MNTSHWRRQLSEAAAIALQQESPTADALAALFYERWYAPAAPTESMPALAPFDVWSRYRAADSAGYRFEPGWRVVDSRTHALPVPFSPFQVAATNGREVRWLDPIDFVFSGGVGIRPQPGAALLVSRYREGPGLPGWWTTLSAPFAAAQVDRTPLVRLYWSVDPHKVFRFVSCLTSCLREVTPYALKAPLDLARCRRADGVVLYLPRNAWGATVDAVRAAHAYVGAALRPSVPALTRELATGLGLAEDPGAESFGMARCRTVAAGIWPLARSNATRDALTGAAESALQSQGVRIEAPHLQPGSTEDYAW